MFSALILDELCRRSSLTTAGILRRLRHQLPRSLSRQTLAAWRRGDQAVPAEVIVAIAVIARVTLIDASVAVAMRVMSEPTADPGLAAALRRYYGAGRVEMPQS